MQDRFFYSISFGFIFGVFLRSLFFINIYLIFCFSFIAICLLFFYKFISKNDLGIFFSIFILFFCLGVFRFNIIDTPPPEFLNLKVGQKITLTGDVVDEPSIGENNQKLIIQLKDVKENIKILLSTNFDNEYKYGDEIKFNGVLKKPENFTTDQGKVFDYINYLRKDGIFFLISYPKIEKISNENRNFFKSILFKIKDKFLEKINLSIKNPENIFLGGLILGEKSSFSQDLRNQFINTGTIHIIALSGYNVTIVAEWVMIIFSFLSKKISSVFGILTILFFIIMTGASSTAIRAGIMAVLALIARFTGRNYDVSRAFLLAFVFMILFNPMILLYDVSFELSFLSTFAVIFFVPKIEKYFLFITERFGLRDIVTITTAVYIFVCPFILYKMGNFSLVAIPTNILILPFIPITMMFGFLTGILGFFSYLLSLPFGYIATLFLSYELKVISLFAHFNYASLIISDFPLFLTILIYIYILYIIFGRILIDFFKNY